MGGQVDGAGAGGVAQRFLRLVAAGAEQASQGGRNAEREDRDAPPRKPLHLRFAAYPQGPESCRTQRRAQAGRPSDALSPHQGKTKRKFKTSTTSQHARLKAANLVEQNFDVPTPNTLWASDITYLPTAEGWLYLAVTLDLFSRKVVGWAFSNRLTDDLTLSALAMATRQRPGGTDASFRWRVAIRQPRLQSRAEGQPHHAEYVGQGQLL